MSGVYFHIPFCKQACTYCDFHFSVNVSRKQALLKAMLRELELRGNYLSSEDIHTVYFGGGTPSILEPEEIGNLLSAVKNQFNLHDQAEITLECNPDDLNAEKLSALKKLGINRLSIGLQSFNDEELAWMNRAHRAADSIRSVKLAQAQGFENITIDLIYGSRFQNMQKWEQTLETVLNLNIQHVSAYNLTIETKTPLGHRYRKGEEPNINEELSAEQFSFMQNKLQQGGFVHYEISNFGLPGFFSKHNTNYWKGVSYLGIGPSAHSHHAAQRQWNVSSNATYIQAIEKGEAYFETENLNLNDQYNEHVLTRLRTMWGCNLIEMEELFGKSYAEMFARKAQRHMKYFNKDNNIYTLNQEGKLMADYLSSELFAG
jgi:oxygen-independent coproporphyrinogen III oxidase